MRLQHARFLEIVVGLSLVVGCGFTPGPPGEGTASTGSGASSGGGGSSGLSSGSTGVGLASGNGGDVGIGNTGSGGMDCGQSNVPLQMLPPDVLIVQDKSLSMTDDKNDQTCAGAMGNNGNCGANSKWSQVSAAIDAVVMADQTNVNFGLMFFGSDTMCGTSTTPIVPVGAMNYTPIEQAFANNQPASYTPTESAVNAAVTYMQTLTDPNPKYLLLATDGLPNCKPNDNNATDDDSPGAEAAVGNALAANFPTFVVGIATSSDAMATATLNAMATAGGRPQTGAATSYYSVDDTASLEAVLNSILSGILSCELTLPNPPANSKVLVSVEQGGNQVQINQDTSDQNGWDYSADGKSIIFHGTDCTNLMNGDYSNIIFSYTCSMGTLIIP